MDNPYQPPIEASQAITAEPTGPSDPNSRPAFFYLLAPAMCLFGACAIYAAIILFKIDLRNDGVFNEVGVPSRMKIAAVTGALCGLAAIAGGIGIWKGKPFGWWLLLVLTGFYLGRPLLLMFNVIAKTGFDVRFFFLFSGFGIRLWLLVYCLSSRMMRFCKIPDSTMSIALGILGAAIFVGICWSVI